MAMEMSDSGTPSPLQESVIDVPDAKLLFNGVFERSGDDLRLSGPDGRSFSIPGYFKSETLSALESPDGALLSGDVVAALAGPANPGKYAGPAASNASAIGHVAQLDGHATAGGNGVAVALNVGDVVLKGDVVQTGSDGALGLTFSDGSAIRITHDSRLVLSTYNYDPNGLANSEIFSLVQGSFSFVAGRIAKTGHMQIGTPVATMQIEGTAGGGDVASDNGKVTLYIFQQDDGLHQATVLDQNGNPIATLRSDGGRLILTPIAPGQFNTDEHSKTDAERAAEIDALNAILHIKDLGNQFITTLSNLQPTQ